MKPSPGCHFFFAGQSFSDRSLKDVARTTSTVVAVVVVMWWWELDENLVIWS
jgi:hypothetical protein